jgi:hypothetical protein
MSNKFRRRAHRAAIRRSMREHSAVRHCPETRKIVHLTEEAAVLELAKIGPAGPERAAYYCPECGGWHLTSRKNPHLEVLKSPHASPEEKMEAGRRFNSAGLLPVEKS